MKQKSTLRRFLAAIGCATIAISSASAADGTWTQTTAGPFDWGTPANWIDDTVADGTDFTAFFTPNITAAQTVNLEAARTIGNITFTDSTTSSNNLTISGANTLTLERTTGASVINVTQTSRILWIDAVLAGNDGLEVTGPGILRLAATATNTLTGGIHLNGGNLGANGATTTTAALNNNDITVTGTSTFVATGGLTTNGGVHLNAGSLLNTGTNNSSYTVNGALTGSGTLRLFQVGQGANTINLTSTANTFTGVVVFALGNINQNSNLNVNSFVDTGTFGEGNIRFNATGNTVGRTHTFALASGAIADLTLTNRQFEIVASTGLSDYFVSNNSSQAFTVNSDILVTATGSRNFGLGGNGAGTSTFNGLIANGTLTNLGMLKTGTGTWSVTGNNTYNAVTEIRQGALSVGSIGSVVGGPSNLGSPDSAANGRIILGNANNTGTLLYTGAAASTERTIQINSSINTNTGGAVITNNGTGALTFTAAAFNDPYANTSTVTRTLTLNGSSGGVIQGIIQNNSATNAVAVTKSGDGTWVFAGNNTYTGATTVSAGTLIINGDQSLAPGAVAVNGTSTLGGSGMIGGTVTVAAEANLAPGTSVGTLSIGGDLTLSAMAGGAGKLIYELGPIAASDKSAVTGTLNIGSDLLGFNDFSFTSLSGLQNGIYKLITSGAAPVGSLDPADLTGTVGTGSGTLQIGGNDIELVVSGIVAGGDPYTDWAGTGVLFDGDKNGDGVSNGLAWLLGAADPDVSALDLLPTVTETGGGLVMTFSMLNAASRGSATLRIEHSSDLGIADAWTTVLVPETSGGPTSGVTFAVTPGSPLNSVTATISSGESANGKLFGRLKATE